MSPIMPGVAGKKVRKVPFKPRKIPIKYIEKKEARMVTFTKRRQGLFSMASTLAELTCAEIAVVAISEAGTAYAHGSRAAIDRFLGEEPMPAADIGAGDWMEVIDEALVNQGRVELVKREAEDVKDCLRDRLVEVKEEDRFGLVEYVVREI